MTDKLNFTVGLARWSRGRVVRLQSKNLGADLLGGVTTAVVSLPMALAFGVASGAGPQAGLTGAIVVGLFAAIFGGTNTLISEPTGPMTVIMTAVIARSVALDPVAGPAIAFTVVMVAGVTQVLFGALRLGRYVTMMPYGVISGFMSGIGILLLITQIGPLLGQSNPAGGALGTLSALPALIAGTRLHEALLAGACLALLFLFPARWRRIAPPQLLVLVLGTVVVLLLTRPELGGLTFRRIGALPGLLPRLVRPSLGTVGLTQIVIDGVVLGMLGCIDSLLTAMIADSLTREHHNSDQELVGQGIANLVSGLLGGLPGAGATMGTVVNIQSGARSPLSAVVRSLVLLAGVALIAPLLALIPMAVLAAIAIKVGFNILDWSFIGRAHRISRGTTLLMYGVMIVTVLVDLVVAVGIGVFVANVITIERLSKLATTKIRTVDSAGGPVLLEPDEKVLLERSAGQVVLFHLSGPMIFGVAQAIARESAALDDRAQVLIVDVDEVSILSTTVALALENVVRDALARGARVLVSGASQQVHDRLSRLGIVNQGARFLPTRLAALQAAIGEEVHS